MPALKNLRHEKFAQEVAKGQPASRAYERAGYKSAPTSRDASASRLLNTDKVRERISELQERVAKKTEVTIESLIEELEQARLMAWVRGQASAMVSATYAKARLVGLVDGAESKPSSAMFTPQSQGDVSDRQVAMALLWKLHGYLEANQLQEALEDVKTVDAEAKV